MYGTDALKYLLASDHFDIYKRLEIEDADATFVDVESVTGRGVVLEADWSENVDQATSSGSIRLFRDRKAASLSPLVYSSALNAGGQLISVGREFNLYVAMVPKGATPSASDWLFIQQGKIDTLDMAKDETSLEFTFRDRGALLLDRWIENEAVYSDADGEPVQDIMQAILDDNTDPPIVGPHSWPLLVPTDPLWSIKEYQQNQESILDALRRLALQIGWDLRWKMYGTNGQLTFYDVNRAKVFPDVIFPTTQYRTLNALDMSDANVRNVIRVVYKDNGQYETSDADSITAFGRRFMQLAYDQTSNIDTETEAIRMATAALADLKWPNVTHEVTKNFWPLVELGDLQQYPGNDVHHDVPLRLSVISFSHHLSAGGGSTTIQGRGTPILGSWEGLTPPTAGPVARTNGWMAIDRRPVIVSTADPTGPAKEGTIWLKVP